MTLKLFYPKPDDSSGPPGEIKFGMITGVYVPTLLTIIGVIMYLRLGWVVGNVGLLGAWLIILLAFTITTTTALSMASVISNIKIGPGGAFSIITRSLGIEIGGSIGVPFYLSMTLSVVMYIFGFRTGVLMLFPSLSPVLIDIITFGAIFGIVLISTDIAFRLEYLIFLIIISSLLAIVGSGMETVPSFTLSLKTQGASFWAVFAVFFPAATGIMAGANMSGELKNPRKSIPIGTLSAIGTSLTIYLILSYWLAGAATQHELVSNYQIMFDHAIFRWVALAGLLAATFSCSLNSLIGASRVLQAMADRAIIPYGSWFTFRGKGGIPRNAILFTAVIALAALMIRDLNTIAPLITMFFMITYATINIVILIEQQLNLISFRPLLKIPIIIPFIGAFGTILTMFVINPVFSLMAIVMILLLYSLLMYRHIPSSEPDGDFRSSLFVSIAEWAAKKSMTLPRSQGKAWRPNILIPIDNPQEIWGVSEFLHNITYPSGSVSILGITNDKNEDWLEKEIIPLVEDFHEEGIYSSWTTIRSDSIHDGVTMSIQAMKSAFFAPNTLFLRRPPEPDQRDEITAILDDESSTKMGIILYVSHPRAALGRRKIIQLFIPDNYTTWQENPDLNFDLALLIAYKLMKNWDAELHLISLVGSEDQTRSVLISLTELLEYARITVTSITVIPETYETFFRGSNQADLNIFSFARSIDFAYIETILTESRSTCLFCRDSPDENVFA